MQYSRGPGMNTYSIHSKGLSTRRRDGTVRSISIGTGITDPMLPCGKDVHPRPHPRPRLPYDPIHVNILLVHVKCCDGVTKYLQVRSDSLGSAIAGPSLCRATTHGTVRLHRVLRTPLGTRSHSLAAAGQPPCISVMLTTCLLLNRRWYDRNDILECMF